MMEEMRKKVKRWRLKKDNKEYDEIYKYITENKDIDLAKEWVDNSIDIVTTPSHDVLLYRMLAFLWKEGEKEYVETSFLDIMDIVRERKRFDNMILIMGIGMFLYPEIKEKFILKELIDYVFYTEENDENSESDSILEVFFIGYFFEYIAQHEDILDELYAFTQNKDYNFFVALIIMYQSILEDGEKKKIGGELFNMTIETAETALSWIERVNLYNNMLEEYYDKFTEEEKTKLRQLIS